MWHLNEFRLRAISFVMCILIADAYLFQNNVQNNNLNNLFYNFVAPKKRKLRFSLNSRMSAPPTNAPHITSIPTKATHYTIYQIIDSRFFAKSISKSLNQPITPPTNWTNRTQSKICALAQICVEQNVFRAAPMRPLLI